jgi:hypothetical protein
LTVDAAYTLPEGDNVRNVKVTAATIFLYLAMTIGAAGADQPQVATGAALQYPISTDSRWT